MDEKRYRLPGAPVFSVPAADAERLVALGGTPSTYQENLVQ